MPRIYNINHINRPLHCPVLRARSPSAWVQVLPIFRKAKMSPGHRLSSDCANATPPHFGFSSRLWSEKRWNPRTRMQTRSKGYICPNDTLVGHSCGTLLWVTLVGNSCGTLLQDTLVGHSCGTLFWDTLVEHSSRKLFWDTLMGHSRGTGHSCRTLLWDTLVGHLWETLVGHSCGTLLWDTLVGRSCRKLLWDTLVGHSCGTLL